MNSAVIFGWISGWILMWILNEFFGPSFRPNFLGFVHSPKPFMKQAYLMEQNATIPPNLQIPENDDPKKSLVIHWKCIPSWEEHSLKLHFKLILKFIDISPAKPFLFSSARSAWVARMNCLTRFPFICQDSFFLSVNVLLCFLCHFWSMSGAHFGVILEAILFQKINIFS